MKKAMKQKPKTKAYIRDFEKTVWGFARTFAKSVQEARRKFDEGDCDEFDNQSDYVWADEIKLDE